MLVALVQWLCVVVAEEYYEEAMQLIGEYNSKLSNVTRIQEALERSWATGNSEAAARLGEFWLLGLPLSLENPNLDHSFFSSSGGFRRDFPLGLSYLKEAYSAGSVESPFFLAFLLELSETIPTFKESLELPKETTTQLYSEGLRRQSGLSTVKVAVEYQDCERSKDLGLPLTFNSSFGQYKCQGNYAQLAHSLVNAGKETIAHIQARGGPE